MDYSSSPDSLLLSPTKARQAAIQAKEWAYVNSWLTRKYSPRPVPSFERNEDTLRALLVIAAANDVADEETSLIRRAREEVVKAYKQSELQYVSSKNQQDQMIRENDLLEDIESHLDDAAAANLNDLAETAVGLGKPTAEIADLAPSILGLNIEEMEVMDQIRKAMNLQSYLECELQTTQGKLGDLKTNAAYKTPNNLSEQTTEWTRSTKLLAVKVSEYHDRISSSQRNIYSEGPTIDDITREEQEVLKLRENIKGLESKIKSYHHLPPDVSQARDKYKDLERKLHQLKTQRDEMFEGLMNTR